MEVARITNWGLGRLLLDESSCNISKSEIVSTGHRETMVANEKVVPGIAPSNAAEASELCLQMF